MKIWKILTMVMTGLAVILAIFSGVMKFAGGAEVLSTLEKVGVLDYRFLLGTMEILFGLLFLFRPTLKIGFILLSCYFSGALATELSHGMPLNALLPLVLVWVAAILRDRSIFLPAPSEAAGRKVVV